MKNLLDWFLRRLFWLGLAGFASCGVETSAVGEQSFDTGGAYTHIRCDLTFPTADAGETVTVSIQDFACVAEFLERP